MIQFHMLSQVAFVTELLKAQRALELLLKAMLCGTVTAQMSRFAKSLATNCAVVGKLRLMRGSVMSSQ